jgi:MFS family permease
VCAGAGASRERISAQGLQWVLSGYLVTYGGLLLLGGRAGDLFGRRRLLTAGTLVFAACSLAGGLAVSAGMLVDARLGQGVGAAMMGPGRAVHPDHHLQLRRRPQPGSRHLGRHLRGVPRRRAD